jgi:hypothetical protein
MGVTREVLLYRRPSTSAHWYLTIALGVTDVSQKLGPPLGQKAQPRCKTSLHLARGDHAAEYLVPCSRTGLLAVVMSVGGMGKISDDSRTTF